MNANTVEIDTVQGLVSDIDHLIAEMLRVRRRITSLHIDVKAETERRSVRDAEWFGMWADREDMQDISSREWLDQLRIQQWAR